MMLCSSSKIATELILGEYVYTSSLMDAGDGS